MRVASLDLVAVFHHTGVCSIMQVSESEPVSYAVLSCSTLECLLECDCERGSMFACC